MLIILIGFVILYGIYCLRKWIVDGRVADLNVIMLLAAASLVLYYDYILGDKTFIFYDIAIDSFGQTYPMLLSKADQIEKNIWREYINFSKGLGNREKSLLLGSGNWFCLFGKESVAKWIGITHYLKQVVAGIITYYWAKCYCNDQKISFIVASGYMATAGFIVRGAWYSYPNDALALMVWVLSFEILHRNGKWYLLPFATIFFFYNASVYDCLLWGGLFAFYIFFRMLADGEGCFKWKRWIQIETLYGAFAILGMADTIVSELIKVLSSDRFVQASSKFSLSASNLFSSNKVLFSAFLRTIGQSINGITNDFTGEISFLDDPTFYCGILLFLIIPAAIYNLDKQKRLYYIIAFGMIGLYIILWPLRLIANGFSSVSFKLSSSWINIFMLIVSMEMLGKLFSGKVLKKGTYLLFCATVIVSLILIEASIKLGYVSRINDLKVSVAFILLYTIAILIMYLIPKKREIISCCVCVAVIVEIVVVSWSTVNDRIVVYKNEFMEKKYYNDYVSDAVQFINSESDGWYRLERQNYSVGPCDALAQGYYGTVSYIGGTEADQGIKMIYKALEFPRQFEDYHSLLGSGGNIYGASLLGVKYYLSSSEMVSRYGFQELSKIGNLTVYENELALPLAYTYDQIISESEFDKLSIFDKSRNILNACVVNSAQAEIESLQPSIFDFMDLYEFRQEIDRSECGYDISINDSQVLVIRLQMSGNGYNQKIFFGDDNGRQCSEIISYENGEKVIEVCCDNLATISFSDSMYNDLSSIEFYIVDREKYFSALRNSVEELQTNSMVITTHDDTYNYIEGEVRCEQPRILATSIPVNENWQIWIDGEEVDVITVNKGFIGCYLEAGEHRVIIYYGGKKWLVDNVFKITGILMSFFILGNGVYNNQLRRKRANV